MAIKARVAKIFLKHIVIEKSLPIPTAINKSDALTNKRKSPVTAAVAGL